MRFRRQGSQPLEVNLVPMMDVLMTVLTFFVIISMTLSSGQKIVNVPLPFGGAGTKEVTPNPLEVGLNRQGQILVGSNSVGEDQLAQAMADYFTSNPEGTVILKADRKIPYAQVVQLLQTMRDIGGDRVSLAVDQN